MATPPAVRAALAVYAAADRETDEQRIAKGEQERADILSRFPLSSWPRLRLEQYALGQDDSLETFCRWMEFRSLNLGSMRGGSAHKLIIYKHDKKAGWHYDPDFEDEQSAWNAVRQGFVDALRLAEEARWAEIDAIAVLQSGSALLLKTLHLYFPDAVLPIYSRAHIRSFLKVLTGEEGSRAEGPVLLNRALLSAVRAIPELAELSPQRIQQFLYRFFDPRKTARMVKVAPGHEARFWDECLAGGYVCVGWEEVGDLREFQSADDLVKAFANAFGDKPNERAVNTRKAKELWRLRELEPGDLVLANKGTSEILALGRVTEPGYVWDETRSTYNHTVKVEWDTKYAQKINPQKNWAFVTVAKVPDALRDQILAKTSPGGPENGPRPKHAQVDPMFDEIATALERKRQVILYGPPGTGKTYTARRFAVWWLKHKAGDPNAAMVLTTPASFAAAERSLAAGVLTRRVWWVVANPKEWSWKALFARATVRFRVGRLQRNFALVRPDDLVIGYESTPEKRVVALARVSRGVGVADASEGPTIELRPVRSIPNGPTYQELQSHPTLSLSEPLRFRNQGTLFALTPAEAADALSLLAAADPDLDLPELDAEAVGALTRVTFHPSYNYEDFVEGYRPVPTSAGGLNLRLKDGVFKMVCREAAAHPDAAYLLVIDEINRANVAKVFGELITLLESDKRGLRVTLAQSGESLEVPPNVYLLGTMNTADRSIRLLDVALRRRFAFIELMPDVDLLSGAKLGALPLDDFLTRLNERIAKIEGREKQIGHAYFLDSGQPLSEPEEFGRVFKQDILPLLQEYCYEDYKRLAQLLGPKLVSVESDSLNEELIADPEALLEALEEEFGADQKQA